MIGPVDTAIIAAIYIMVSPPLTNAEIVEVVNKCKAETVNTVENHKKEIILIYCND